MPLQTIPFALAILSFPSFSRCVDGKTTPESCFHYNYTLITRSLSFTNSSEGTRILFIFFRHETSESFPIYFLEYENQISSGNSRSKFVQIVTREIIFCPNFIFLLFFIFFNIFGGLWKNCQKKIPIRIGLYDRNRFFYRISLIPPAFATCWTLRGCYVHFFPALGFYE